MNDKGPYPLPIQHRVLKEEQEDAKSIPSRVKQHALNTCLNRTTQTMDWLFVLETISKSSPVFDNRQGKGPAQDEYDMNTGTAHEVSSMKIMDKLCQTFTWNLNALANCRFFGHEGRFAMVALDGTVGTWGPSRPACCAPDLAQTRLDITFIRLVIRRRVGRIGKTHIANANVELLLRTKCLEDYILVDCTRPCSNVLYTLFFFHPHLITSDTRNVGHSKAPLSKKFVSSSLWSKYSMLKAMLQFHEDFDISKTKTNQRRIFSVINEGEGLTILEFYREYIGLRSKRSKLFVHMILEWKMYQSESRKETISSESTLAAPYMIGIGKLLKTLQLLYFHYMCLFVPPLRCELIADVLVVVPVHAVPALVLLLFALVQSAGAELVACVLPPDYRYHEEHSLYLLKREEVSFREELEGDSFREELEGGSFREELEGENFRQELDEASLDSKLEEQISSTTSSI
ncbi:hypothetical protein C0J52_04582 [Blattella germanica]|nr:hypothetical protein C0J52_04582 [Blattella germanica]